MKEIKQNGIYRHYKGNLYRVKAIATHSESLEKLVIYSDLEGKKVWARPIAMWDEEIEVEGQKVKRFTFIR